MKKRKRKRRGKEERRKRKRRAKELKRRLPKPATSAQARPFCKSPPAQGMRQPHLADWFKN